MGQMVIKNNAAPKLFDASLDGMPQWTPLQWTDVFGGPPKTARQRRALPDLSTINSHL